MDKVWKTSELLYVWGRPIQLKETEHRSVSEKSLDRPIWQIKLYTALSAKLKLFSFFFNQLII